MYGGLSSVLTFRGNLSKSREKFIALPVIDQAKVLLQCVKFMKCDTEAADLSLVGCGKRCGILLINQNITDINITVVHTSECGLTERRMKI